MGTTCRVRQVQNKSDVVDWGSKFSESIFSTESNDIFGIPNFDQPGRFRPPSWSSVGIFRISVNPFYRKTHSDQMLHIIYGFSHEIEWMSFPVKRSV